MAHCEQGEKTLISKLDKTENTFTILIGPEGDFTPAEIALGTEKGYDPLSFGNSRLRTETATLLSVASIYNTFI